MVRTTLPRIKPRKPCWRISRSTVQRVITKPSRLAVVLKGLVGCHGEGLLFHLLITLGTAMPWT
jgi:hypothetical protein